MRPTWGITWWPVYLILASAFFLIPEIIALITNSVNTLSDYSWYELGINGHVNQHSLAWIISFIAWLLFVGVITAHIWFRTPG